MGRRLVSIFGEDWGIGSPRYVPDQVLQSDDDKNGPLAAIERVIDFIRAKSLTVWSGEGQVGPRGTWSTSCAI